jgi:UDP-N-acetylmuramate: L-alanyl-gamma-D-glutamyl-meso-diaminopimelate ligase
LINKDITDLSKPLHYHLIGICGTAMASLAGMLKAKGYRVTGSDANVYPPMSTQLAAWGIEINQGYHEEHLQPHPDFVVVGNAIARGNLEVEYTLNNRLHYVSMPEVVKEQFIRGRQSIVVAGTHGKTTTTSLMAWVLEVAGYRPSFLIGGVAENFGTSFQITDSDYFVIEGDEYDTAYFDKGPKFMHYLPTTLIINNVEFDHADIYADTAVYKTAFRRLVNLVPNNGQIIAGVDSPLVVELLSSALATVETFATEVSVPKTEVNWQAPQIITTPQGTQFRVTKDGKEWGELTTSLVGRFNVRNSLAVIAAATHLGVPAEKIRQALATFRSVKRRMEVLGEVGGVTVIDDFAHHPTAVTETLAAIAARYRGRRLVAIFEPRSWSSRKKVFQTAYEQAFAPAAQVVIAPVFESFKLRAEDQFSPEQLVDALQAQGKQACAIAGAANIVAYLAAQVQPGDVLAIMSNGGFEGIHHKILEMLRQQLPQ